MKGILFCIFAPLDTDREVQTGAFSSPVKFLSLLSKSRHLPILHFLKWPERRIDYSAWTIISGFSLLAFCMALHSDEVCLVAEVPGDITMLENLSMREAICVWSPVKNVMQCLYFHNACHQLWSVVQCACTWWILNKDMFHFACLCWAAYMYIQCMYIAAMAGTWILALSFYELRLIACKMYSWDWMIIKHTRIDQN